MDNGYTCIWEFHVAPESQREFELHYGPDGIWVQLFRQAAGFIETLLLKDRSRPGRFVTIDRWRSEEDYASFRHEFATEYAQLDTDCQRLTQHERMLGTFSE
jgi:heme-degrading monooxygenase HmoA